MENGKIEAINRIHLSVALLLKKSITFLGFSNFNLECGSNVIWVNNSIQK